MTYWQNRQQQLNNQLEKDEGKLKAKLSNSYDIQLKSLEKEIASYYQTYGENNVIEYRKLMESLSDEDKQLLLQRMDEFAEKYPQYAHLMPVRESIYKLNRLEGLQTSIKMQQLEMGAIDNAELQSHFEQLALRSANSSAEMLGFGKNFYTVNSDLISKTVNKQWADGRNFSERIWKNREKLADYLNNDFAMAIARGDSYEKCIKALGERFGKVSRNDIYRLIYTEGTFVQNEASITSFEEDFEEYEISIADERACKHCKAMSGKKFSIKDRQAGVNFPPFHSWCRCSFTIAVDDWDKWMDEYVEKHGEEPGNPIKSVENSGESDIINSNKEETAVNDVHKIGVIDISKYKCVAEDIKTDEVIITEKQIEHIKERHPNDYERFSQFFKEIIEEPDYIIEANKTNTALILKEIKIENKKFKTVLRLVTSTDNPEYKNSIITFMKIDDKEWNRILKNKNILYKFE